MKGEEKFLDNLQIEQMTVADMVRSDYRTAAVFKKYGIEFCCGGKWPLQTVCLMKGMELPFLLNELDTATRNVVIPRAAMFHEWNPDFLIDYILHVHHQYLKKALPEAEDMLDSFAAKHLTKYTYIADLQEKFKQVAIRLRHIMEAEETTVFPYIRQVFHAFENQESYAALLVKTLKKSFSDIIQKEGDEITEMFIDIREITNHYTPPRDGCVSHILNFAVLQELDNDVMQHLFLEESVLFPKAMQIEKELLQSPF